tara:strand:- start:4680 stop:5399 length:720 start_codon:yes stop_codon:yes gene_type:complete
LEDFLKDYYSILNDVVLLLAVIATIFVYKKYKFTHVKYFLWFLVYSFFVDLIGGYTVYVSKYPFFSGIKDALEGTLFEKNYWWYNTFWAIGSALFYSFYFRKVIDTKLYKKILNHSRKIFLVIALGYIVFNINLFFNSSIIVVKILGAIVVLLSTVLFFMEILKSNKVLAFYKTIDFYIASVVFIWFLVRTPIVFYDVYFTTKDWDYVILKSAILLITNMFMYLTFSFALLWCRPQNDL